MRFMRFTCTDVESLVANHENTGREALSKPHLKEMSL